MKLGTLGKGYTHETDNERRNLHFGLKPGKTLDIRGYVQTESELSKWVDPVAFLKEHGL